MLIGGKEVPSIGNQVICLLSRIARLIGHSPRRVGLSATCGDLKIASDWLGAGSGRETVAPVPPRTPLKWRLGLEHFYIQNPNEIQTDDASLSTADSSKKGGYARLDPGFEFLYDNLYGKKALVFSNSREETEYVTATLRQISRARGDEDVFYIHHGNLSASLREAKILGYEDDKILGPTGAVGVPEFNTRFTRGVLLDTMPTKFDFLVRICGYTHGTDVWLGNAKDLIVSGVAKVDQTIGARDDIMIYLISCGMPEKRAFKIMESVRKGKGLPPGAEEEMVAAGVPDWYIGSCKKIKYLFPKAHAVAYCMMAFRIAWFKVYHPLAFYAAYFYRRSQKGGFDAALMTGGMEMVKANIDAIEKNADATNKDEDLLITLEVAYEFYLRGFEFLPIDIYESHATKFLIKDGKILPPFVAVSGLGESAAWDIMNGSKGKKFLSIEEFAAACPKASKTHIQMLKEAGAFGDLPDTSQVNLFDGF